MHSDREDIGAPPSAGRLSPACRPSRTQLSLAATLLFGLASVAVVFGPRKVGTALAADPQGNNRLNTLARVESPVQLSRDLSAGVVVEQPTIDERVVAVGRTYPVPNLPRVQLAKDATGGLALSGRPQFTGKLGDRFAGLTAGNNYVFYSIDPALQDFVDTLVKRAQASHVAVVAMNPRTGAVLAIAGKSVSRSDIEYHAGFPAASLFKVVTAAAAIEQAGVQPDSLIPFRGGTYTLNESNYLPDSRRDTRTMSVAEALGRSCNPVFGHIGVKYLNGSILARYAKSFGFNRPLGLEVPMPASSAAIPADDLYGLSRTAAGFGEVRISPIHAAAFMSGVANGGLLPRPFIVEKVVSPDGAVLHRSSPEMLQRIVKPATAQTLLDMMKNTTTIGTSRREFMRGTRPTLGDIEVAAKTGTLKGSDPEGLNNWFIAAAPIANPELAIAVITVDPRLSSKASHLGRRVFERYFNITPTEREREFEAVVRPVKPTKSKYRSIVPKKQTTKRFARVKVSKKGSR